MDRLHRLDELVGIMDRLRDPGGCPWDREQSYESLRRYLLEEAHEVAEALDREDRAGLREELGDLLFQIVFLSRLAKEDGHFTIDDVVRGIAEKMIRRHPHVFGSASAETSEEVVSNWEKIKREEKGARPAEGDGSILDGIPVSLPATLKAVGLGTRAARVGFDWEAPAEILDKIEEEISELRAVMHDGDREVTRDELGDLLFSTVMLARHMKVDPEAALERTNLKFRRRFGWIEQALRERGVDLEEAGLPLLEQLWADAKRQAG